MDWFLYDNGLLHERVKEHFSFVNLNNDSTSDTSVTPHTPLKDSETPNTKSIPHFTLGLKTPTKKTIENATTNPSEKYIDTMTQYEKNKIESFKENILQNLLNTIKQRIYHLQI